MAKARLYEKYVKEIAPALQTELGVKNPMAVPKIHKVVINMGVGEATQNAKVLDPAVNELGQITGQKPVVTRAKKSIAMPELIANRLSKFSIRAKPKSFITVPGSENYRSKM